MGFKAYLAGILTGAVCMLAGYMVSHADRLAAADAGGGTNGIILATPPQGANEGLIYVMKTEPAEDMQLAIYRTSGKGDLELVSSRRVTFDLKLWNMGAKGAKPEEYRAKLKQNGADGVAPPKDE